MKTINPGSDEAIKEGCTCPILDNGHGVGFELHGETVFWIAQDCLLHGNKNKRRHDGSNSN